MPIFESASAPERSVRRYLGWWLLVIALLLGLVVSLLPAPYVIDQPGPVFDTLGTVTDKGEEVPMISIPGEETYPTDGELNLLTVNQRGNPDDLPNWTEVLLAWFNSSKAVLPVSEVYPEGITSEQIAEAGQTQMVDSQQDAIAAALTELGYTVTTTFTVGEIEKGSAADGLLQKGDVLVSINGKTITSVEFLISQLKLNGTSKAATIVVNRDGVETTVEVTPTTNAAGNPALGIIVANDYVFPFTVQIQLNQVGGPSAGMMFALGIIDKLTPGSLTGGEIIAGTGTIAADGTVGAIGGIQQKMYGAVRAGATYFLAPKSNCDEVTGHVPDGIRVFAVSTLEDSLDALKAVSDGGDLDAIPTCPSE